MRIGGRSPSQYGAVKYMSRLLYLVRRASLRCSRRLVTAHDHLVDLLVVALEFLVDPLALPRVRFWGIS